MVERKASEDPLWAEALERFLWAMDGSEDWFGMDKVDDVHLRVEPQPASRVVQGEDLLPYPKTCCVEDQ